jgi:hypothetical protein
VVSAISPAKRHWVGRIAKIGGDAAGTVAIGRAEALRRSMLALMETPNKPYYAHPLFWAPFVVVGEGARQ